MHGMYRLMVDKCVILLNYTYRENFDIVTSFKAKAIFEIIHMSRL